MHDSIIGCIQNWWSIFIVHCGCSAEATDFKSPLIYKVQDLNVCKGFKLCEIVRFLPCIVAHRCVFSSLSHKPETLSGFVQYLG